MVTEAVPLVAMDAPVPVVASRVPSVTDTVTDRLSPSLSATVIALAPPAENVSGASSGVVSLAGAEMVGATLVSVMVVVTASGEMIPEFAEFEISTSKSSGPSYVASETVPSVIASGASVAEPGSIEMELPAMTALAWLNECCQKPPLPS